MRHAHITALPASDLGRWSVALTAAFFALVLAGTVIPRGVALAFACGLAGAAAAIVAIVRDHERAVTVFAALVPVAIVVAFFVAELVGGV